MANGTAVTGTETEAEVDRKSPPATEERDEAFFGRFKTILNNRLEKLEGRLQAKPKKDETGSSRLIHPGLVLERGADMADWATAEAGLRTTLCLREHMTREEKKIREALIRIKEKTFGICAECGDPIATARLEKQPISPLCVACGTEREETEKLQNGGKPLHH